VAAARKSKIVLPLRPQTSDWPSAISCVPPVPVRGQARGPPMRPIIASSPRNNTGLARSSPAQVATKTHPYAQENGPDSWLSITIQPHATDSIDRQRSLRPTRRCWPQVHSAESAGTTVAWLELLLCPLTAIVTWTIAKARASATLAREYEAMQKEIRVSREEEARAAMRAAQLEQEMAAWNKGCRQGREDVIAIMPLLLAARERFSQSEPSPRETPIAS
jgi:hypothetical protein